MKTRTVRSSAAIAALMLLAVGAAAPRPASAQFGSLVVNITAPADGATVTGTIPVRASVTIIGALTVDSVQFKLDGANLGAADASAPYSVNWDTRTAANGSHTLTAVARDFFGAQYTSPPVTVTVNNAPPPDTTAPNVSVTSPASGATVSNTITLQASASDNVGVAGVQFFVDGTARGSEDTSAPYSVSWDTKTASNGGHSITARARDAAGNARTSSAVSVTVSNGPPADTTRPSVSMTSPASGATVSGTVAVTADASDNVGVAGVQFLLDGSTLGAEDTVAPYSVPWDTTTAANGSHALSARARDAAGNTQVSAVSTVTVSNTAPPGTVTRVQENAAAVTYAGAWTQGDTTFAWSGGTAAYSRGPGAQATLNFTGTQVSWIGWREPRGGIARVLLDGVQVGMVDLYAPAAAISEAVFTSATLAEGPHTLVVEATGTKNASASDTIVVVDAFDVTSSSPPPPPPPPDPGRHQENDPAIAYAGPWFEETTFPWTDGRAMFAVNEGSATFTFNGTGVSWIGYRGHYGGIVRVLIDGAEVATLDTYTTPDQVGVPVYTASGLTPGTHTIRIELTGLKNPAADASETAVDAFDVTQ